MYQQKMVGVDLEIRIDVSVHVDDPEIQRFGFRLTAVDQAGRAMGRFIITDPENTQILQNHTDLTDRQHVTYTKAGHPSYLIEGNIHGHSNGLSLLHIWNSVHFFYLQQFLPMMIIADKGDRVYLRDTVINLQQMLTTHERIDKKY
jgi:hypothetical protein